MSNEDLIKIACVARENAFARISNYKVGAALLTADGVVYTGCNIEDPSGIGVTNCCAERVAFLKALSEKERKFLKIAVVGGLDDTLELCTPCGVCRQYMINFNPNLTILSMDNDKIIEYKLKDLLPNAWYKDITETKE